MKVKGYEPCQYCGRINHDNLGKCGWCYRDIPTRRQRIFNATVFWSSIAGILGAAYVAYRIGGW